MQKNEVQLCEIVVQLLEKELGSPRDVVTYPEKDGSGPPVDMRVELGKSRYALEHTIIEPFEKAIQTEKEFTEFVAEIARTLDRTLPTPGVYHLHFPAHPTAARHRRTHAALQKAMIEWARAAAKALYAEMPERVSRGRQPHDYKGFRTTELHGLSITLHRQVHWAETGVLDGRLIPCRILHENVEDLRRARICTALDRKLGKLANCARAGDRTILILENNDIVLSNQVVIACALKENLEGRDYSPDNVFIADTCLDDSWSLFRPIINKQFSIDMKVVEIGRVRWAG